MAKRDIEAGRAYVLLEMKDQLTRQLGQSQRKLKDFGRQVRFVGYQLTGMATAVLGPMAAMVAEFTRAGNEIDKVSRSTNLAVDTLQELTHAAEQLSQAGVRDLEVAFRNLSRVMMGAEETSAAGAEALNKIGLSIEQLRGLSPEQQFMMAADAISRYEDEATQAAAAQAIFGRSATRILPMLQAGREGIQQLRDEAHELDIVMSEENTVAAAKLTDELDKLLKVVRAAGRAVAAELVPMIVRLVERSGEWLKGTQAIIRESGNMIRTVAMAATALGGFGTTLISVGVAAGIAATSLGALKVAIKATGTAIMALKAHPVIAGLAALAAAVAYISYRMGEAERIARQLSREIREQTKWADRTMKQQRALRTEDERRMQRLEELYDIQRKFGRLTESELREATSLLEVLDGRGKAFGVTIDENTGKITGMAGAMERMVDHHYKMAELDIARQIRAYRGEIRQIERDLPRIVDADRAREEVRRLHELKFAILDLDEALEAISRGETVPGVRVDEPGADPEAGAAQSASDRERILSIEERARERLNRLRAEQIKDEHERETRLLKLRYDQEIKQAKDAEASTAAIRAAYRIEQAALDKRIADAKEEEEKRQAERIARHSEGLEGRLARARIEQEHRQDPAARRLALLELEEAEQLDALQNMEHLNERQLHEMQEMVRELFETRRQLVEQQEPPGMDRQITPAAVSFSAAALQQMGGGRTQERIERHTRNLVQEAREQVRQQRAIVRMWRQAERIFEVN